MGQSPEAGLPHAGPAAVRAGSPSGADVACSRRGSGGRSAPNGGGTRPGWPSARGRPLDLCARVFRRSDPAPQAPPGSRSGRGRPFSWRPSRSFAPGWEIPSRSVGGVGYSGRISGTACCPAWARLAREVALGLLETTGDEAGTAASARLPGAAAAGDPASRPHSSASAAHQRGACWQNRRFLVSRAGVRSPRLVCAWAPRRRAEPACAPLGSLLGS
ncbi:uncharacterized protein LOC123932724 [Meles meles]|uniref:uncharacterized protein LOC123932724 n=1 Tax=Meles meles TaxID=9662 RepID=UPI001E69D3F4|nr:uncharacterized protein LOC123932724 [Meles meles]